MRIQPEDVVLAENVFKLVIVLLEEVLLLLAEAPGLEARLECS